MGRKSKEEYNAYMRTYMLKRYYAVRAALVETLGGKCARCGSIDNLEIDHVDRNSKEIDCGKLWSFSNKRILKEIAKCQLLCKTCHTEKSILERGMKVAKGQHGTISSYRYCKCDLCREAKSEHNNRYLYRKGLTAR